MSEVKVNKISPRTNCGTVQLGDSGDTITIPAGATITNNGTAAGFGSTGEISWDTTPKTGDFTGVSGVGYFVNTAGGAVTVTLPGSPSAGNVIGVSDYNSTAATNAITINRNSNKINGDTNDLLLSKGNSAVQLVYIDATTGWQTVFTGNTSDLSNNFIVATGGTESTDGDYKIHTFTGPGTFSVTNAGTASGSTTVEYVVVAGGGAGGTRAAGGGGAGGFRFYGDCIAAPYPASPLNGPAALPVSVQSYPITVGSGGTGTPPSCNEMPGGDGSNSVFSTITSTGGGGGLGGTSTSPGRTGNGGSGGGGSPSPTSPNASGGTGNSPPVSPAQGNNGGPSGVNYNGAGGGGALAVGQAAGPTPGVPSAKGGNGGVGGGFPTTHFGSGQVSSCVSYFSGGGGGGSWTDFVPGPGGTGGLGGGATGVTANTQPTYPTYQANSGTANTGGGGGGGGGGPRPGNPTGNALLGGNGGSGIVIIRYKYQ